MAVSFLFSGLYCIPEVLASQKAKLGKCLFALCLMGMLVTGAFGHSRPKIQLSQYVSQTWGAEEGLPQNTVSKIVQTVDGFLWFGTQEGLVRFDGFEFKTYDQFNTPQLTSNDITCLAADPTGGLWIGLYNGGLAYFHEDVFTRPISHDLLQFATIRSILIDEEEVLYLGTESIGLFVVRDGQVERMAGPFGKHKVSALAKWPDGNLLVGTAGEGLLNYEDGVFREIPLGDHPLSRFITKMVFVPGKGFFVGTQGAGLFLVNEMGVRQVHYAEDEAQNLVHTLSMGKQGDLWWGTDRGLVRMVESDIEYFFVRDSGRTDYTDSLMHDREGNLWAGIPGIGLIRYTQGILTTINSEEGLCNDVVWSLVETRDHKIIAGTESGGYCVLVKGKVDSEKISKPLDTGNIDCMAVDSQNRLWMGKFNGMYLVSGGSVEKIGEGNPIFDERIFPLYVDGKDRVWFGSGSQFYRLNEHRAEPVKYESLDALTISCLAEDVAGHLWIGASEGLFKLTDDGMTLHRPPAGRHGSRQIYGLYPDGGGLWISHENYGLGWFENGTFKFFEDAGLPKDVPYSILEDDFGYLWYSSNRGIVRVAKSELRSWLINPNAQLKWRQFGIPDGMKNPECNLGGIPSVIKDNQGHLWFSTVGGVVTVDPETIVSQKMAPIPYFSDVLVDGSPWKFSEDVHLPAKFESLEIRFGAIEYHDSLSIQFRTKLDGMTPQLQAQSGNLAAYFTQLPAGQMTFSASAGNPLRGFATSTLKLHVPATKSVLVRNRLLILLGMVSFLMLGFLAWKWYESGTQVQLRTESFSQLQETEKNRRALLNRTAERLNRAHLAADKAVVQTHLLHNVGNILNSVSVSSGLMEKMLRSTGLYGLIHKILSLLKSHESRVAAFLTKDEQGKRVPGALSDIAEIMEEGKQALFNELANLQLQCAHIQDVVKSIDQAGERFEFCRLSLIAEDALKLQGYLIAKNGVQVSREFDEDLYVSSQKAQLLQILVNIIKNAVESLASSHQEEALTLEIQAYQRSDESVILEIIDNGIGIKKEDLDRLFEKGFTTKKYGHGLGLSYCRTKMREMGGDLIVHSEGEGKGATFSLIFSGNMS